ncbi:MAG: calcium-binding protein [Planctomycetota bacterium]
MSLRTRRKRQNNSNLGYQSLESRKFRAGFDGGTDPIVYLVAKGEQSQIWNVKDSKLESKTNELGESDRGISLEFDPTNKVLSVNSSNAEPLIFSINWSYALTEDGIDYSRHTSSLVVRNAFSSVYGGYEVYGIVNDLNDQALNKIVIRGGDDNDRVRFTTNFHSESIGVLPEIDVAFYGRDGHDSLSFQSASYNDYWTDDFKSHPESFAYLNITAIGGNGDDYLEGHWVKGEDGNDVLRNPAARGDLPFENQGAMILPLRESTLDGGAGDDHILGFGTLLGRSGNDTLEGKGTMDGGFDDDILRAKQFISYDWDHYYENFSDGIGKALIFHDEGSVMNGSYGHDKIFGSPGNDKINGGSGNDAIFGGLGNDEIRGGTGNDVIFGNSPAAWDLYEAVTVHHVAPNLHYTSDWYNTLSLATDPRSRFPDDRTSYGRPGFERDFDNNEDRSDFQSNSDGIRTETRSWVTRYRIRNKSEIKTETHFQYQFQRSDIDKIYGDSGADQIFGNWGNDLIEGGNGNDRINGGSGNDTIYGESTSPSSGFGNDTIRGGYDHDRIYGGIGKDVIYGDQGNDRLYGGYGKDKVYGGTGHDYLAGGNYSNWWTASRWNYDTQKDYLYGGSGNDTFVQTWKDQRERYWFFGWRYRTRTVSEDSIMDFQNGDRHVFSNIRPA